MIWERLPGAGLGGGFRAGQSPSGLGLGDALQLPEEDIVGALWVLRAQRRVQFEGCVTEPLQTITAILRGTKWSCLLLRIVLQDALSEVTQFYLPLKLRVFVDDITVLLIGKNKEVAEMAENVMKKLKEEVEEKGLKFFVTENGKEGKSKMIASCGYLEEQLCECSKDEGVILADSVETLEDDLRTKVKRLRSKEKARRRTCKVRFSLIKKNKAFQKIYMKVETKKLSRMGLVSARACGAHAVGIAPTERLKTEEADGSSSRQEEVGLALPFLGNVWSRSGTGALHFGHPDFGLVKGALSNEKHG